MTRQCQTPVSWLALERLHTGELRSSEQLAVQGHLATCPDCAALYHTIASDMRGLPALPALAQPKPRMLRRRQWVLWSPIVALSAAAAIVFLRTPASEHVPNVRTEVATKGGDTLIMELIRKRDEHISYAPLDYQPGDVFVTRVGCSAALPQWVVVAVDQGGEVSIPYSARKIDCRDGAAELGAFILDGELPARVCVRAFDSEPSGLELRSHPGGPRDACVELRARR